MQLFLFCRNKNIKTFAIKAKVPSFLDSFNYFATVCSLLINCSDRPVPIATDSNGLGAK